MCGCFRTIHGPSVTLTTTIARPREEVFEYLADVANHADLVAQGPADRVRMFRDFDPRATDADRDVPDPYYRGDGGFEHVLDLVERTCDGLVAALARVPVSAGD